MARYDHQKIEKEVQEMWAGLELYKTDLEDTSKDPYYLLFEFPFPSGDLHIGHWYAFALTDIYARYLRMQGKQVLFPMGFDSFGLPAENASIKNNATPNEWVYENIEKMRGQVRSMGTSVDWSKEVVTSDPEYYKWTQWLFTKLFEHSLAEHREAKVKWCPKDHTVLANEQVIDGHCERCDTPVEEKNLTQWFLKITQYAERLINDLDPLPWREEIKDAQRAWIGKSEGAKLSFAIKGPGIDGEKIEVFTTRPDTLYGATYVVLAPEHALVETLISQIQNADDVREYKKVTSRKSERERSENKEKTGIELKGVVAINPVNQEELPIYIADYVLASYGTGAVMAVPAHDERDFEFAQKMNLPVKQVVVPCAEDPNNPPQEGMEMVKRDTVVVHLRDKSTGKFALLDWHGTLEGITTAIMGGIEEGQTPEEAALMEISEEAGLEHAQIVQKSPFITASRYCASHKHQNRTAHTHVLLAEVEHVNDQKNVTEYEQHTHTLVWVEEKDVLSRLTPPHQKKIWELLHKEEALTGEGYLINSGEFDGRDNTEAMWDIVTKAGGERTTNYRIRDWLVSRQRYWGCPIPIVYDPEGTPHAVPLEHLPWTLPTDVSSSTKTEDGKGPLSASQELLERTEKLFGPGWTPECDTFDVFMDSSWYFTRYLAPHNDTDFSDPSLMKRFLPVNRYSGGNEHTTVHLLYARFFYKALYDLALVPTSEPFFERFNRGLILGPDGQKMSKRWGNVVNPDEMVEKYGADAVRIYLAFIGPYNEPGNYPWQLEGVSAMRKFLERVTGLAERVQDVAAGEDEQRALAKAIQKVTTDIERFKFNTALAALMTLSNTLSAQDHIAKETYVTFLKLLAPLAPHLAEHLYRSQNQEGSVHVALWPVADEALLSSELVTVTVQINGKRRGEILLSPSATEEEALGIVHTLPVVRTALETGGLKRTIYVPGRTVNLVVV